MEDSLTLLVQWCDMLCKYLYSSMEIDIVVERNDGSDISFVVSKLSGWGLARKQTQILQPKPKEIFG